MVLGDVPGPSDLDAALERSRGCPECGGCGLTTRELERETDGGECVPMRASCYCPRCDAGKELRVHHLTHSPKVARRILWIRDNPELAAGDHDRMGLDERERYLAAFRAFGLARRAGRPLARSAPEARRQPIASTPNPDPTPNPARQA